jgi:hypothetical protein
MRHWAVFGLTMLTACMGGPASVEIGGSPPASLEGPGVALDDPQPLGHAGFGLLLNDVRDANGVTLVMEDPLLNQAAQDHAADMVANDYLSHVDLEGGTAADRVLEVGYDYDFIAENIAQGIDSSDEVIAAWMGSPGHRDNMLDPRADDFGVGMVDDTWVLLLGSEFPAP